MLILYEICRARITAHYLLLLSIIFTTYHYFYSVDLGLTINQLHNFFAWHFCHRSYAHMISNAVMLILLLGSEIGVSLINISVISAFALAISYFDTMPFYGASGLAYFLVGYVVGSGRVPKSFSFIASSIEMPYLLPMSIMIFANIDASLSLAVMWLHLFSFLYGIIDGVFGEAYGQIVSRKKSV